MSEYIKNALLNLQDFEKKVIENYKEKDRLEQKVKEVENKYQTLSSLYYLGNHMISSEGIDYLLPDNINTRSGARYAIENTKKQLYGMLDQTGKRINVNSVKNDYFNKGPSDTMHLKNNKEYDGVISKYANEVNKLKSNLKRSVNVRFERAVGSPSVAMIFGLAAVSMFLIVCIILSFVEFIDFPFGLINLILATILVGLIIAVRKQCNIKENIEDAKASIKRAVIEYNSQLMTLYTDALSKITEPYINEQINKEKALLAPLFEENEYQLKKYTEEYHSKETVSNEVIDLYGSLDDPEKELFIRLGVLAKEEKELTDVYAKCLESKNQRLILEEERARTYEAIKQTQLAEQQVKEIKRQTRVMQDEADRQASIMRGMAADQAAAAKSQEAYNKKQLSAAKKQTEATKRLEEEQRYYHNR